MPERTHPVPALRVGADPASLELIAPAWDELGSSLPSPMQQLAWLRAAGELPGLRLHVLALRDGSAVAPLESSRGRLETATVNRLHEPVDLLWESEDALGRLGEGLAHLGVPLLLRRVPAGSPSLGVLRTSFGRKAITAVRRRPALPVLHLTARSQEPEAILNSGRRSDLRRARRLAGEQGEVDFEYLAPSPRDADHLLSVALSVEAHSWKGRTGTALTQDPVRLPFYLRYAAEQAQNGSLRIAFLRVEGRPVAMQLAVERANRLWLLKIGYDESWARCSPGHLLMIEVVRKAAHEGLSSIEFLGSEAPWTREWTRDERPCVAAAFYPLRPRSALPIAHDAVRVIVRRLTTMRSP
jgi:CelD/BcsL family acetyltransferase involved in cellulose biosynthesis